LGERKFSILKLVRAAPITAYDAQAQLGNGCDLRSVQRDMAALERDGILMSVMDVSRDHARRVYSLPVIKESSTGGN
jgi:hypothetical protein